MKLFILSLLLLSAPAFASQPLDHCISCKKLETIAPAAAPNCPNLMDWGESAVFLKSIESKLPSVASMKKQPVHIQFSKFLSAFKEATKDFKGSLNGDETAESRAVKARLLSSVGWNQPQTWPHVEALVKQEPRVAAAARNLACELMETRVARADCDGDFSDLNESERTFFLRRLEAAVVDYLSDGVTIGEMIDAEVIPTEGARARLLMALMERKGLQHALIFAVPKKDMKLACEAKIAKPVRFTIFSVGSSAEGESVTLVNSTQEGLHALQSFPALGEWVSFRAQVQDSRSPSSAPAELPVCFQNAQQVREYACKVWRNQQ
ncbi:MAG TPA: hypothetical protein VFV50_10710 [Bdellovibrionales bacterium]|nr:hypothetical protein [Bdellovibrionales bacterium]